MEFSSLMAARSLIDRQNHTLTQVGRVSIRHAQRLQKSNLEGSVRSRGETATALTVRDLIEAGLNKPAGSQALWG